jgi:hypothetical protein
MVISWTQSFNAKWTYKGKSDGAKYSIHAEVEGPERSFMTDVAPIIKSIAKLEGKSLSSYIGKSSLEAVALYVKNVINKLLDKHDKLRRLKITENDFFAVEV